MGTKPLDVEFVQSAGKLRLALATGGLVIDPEHTGLVAVKRQRLAVSNEVIAQGAELGKGRFGMHKAQGGDLAGRIVYEHDGRTRWRSSLKPAVVATVNLDQFTKAGTTITRLLDPWWSLPARHP